MIITIASKLHDMSNVSGFMLRILLVIIKQFEEADDLILDTVGNK
jgi:hypothetical protein